MKEKLISYLVLIWIMVSTFFIKVWLFTVRVIKNTGPHSKHCKCSKWGIYTDMKCKNPGHQLIIRGGTKLVKR